MSTISDAIWYTVVAPYFINGHHNVNGLAVAKELNDKLWNHEHSRDLDKVQRELDSLPKEDIQLWELRIHKNVDYELVLNDTFNLGKLVPTSKAMQEGGVEYVRPGTYKGYPVLVYYVFRDYDTAEDAIVGGAEHFYVNRIELDEVAMQRTGVDVDAALEDTGLSR